MTSRRTAISCRMCGAPGRWYLGGRLCPRHAPGGPDGEVMRPFPDYTGRISQVGAGTINAVAPEMRQPPERELRGRLTRPEKGVRLMTQPTGTEVPSEPNRPSGEPR